jgi:hypothetical protein
MRKVTQNCRNSSKEPSGRSRQRWKDMIKYELVAIKYFVKNVHLTQPNIVISCVRRTFLTKYFITITQRDGYYKNPCSNIVFIRHRRRHRHHHHHHPIAAIYVSSVQAAV